MATLINLRVTFLVGVGELQPVMSLSTSTECSVPLPAVVRRSKEEAGLDREACGQQKTTAALGQHSHSTAVGQTNCAESQTQSAHWWITDFLSPCKRLHIWCGDDVRSRGISFQNSEYEKMVDFTVGAYFSSIQPALPHAICFICCPFCLLLGFHTAHTNCFICQPTNQSRRSGNVSNCGQLANSSTGCQQQLS